MDYRSVDDIFVKDIKPSLGGYAVVKSINEIGQLIGKRNIAVLSLMMTKYWIACAKPALVSRKMMVLKKDPD